MKQDNKQLIVYGGGIVLLYFGVLRPILNKLGITKSPEQRVIDAQNNLPNKDNPFSPVFYKQAPSGALLLTRKSAEYYAKQIYDAMGVFSDDESKVYGVFRAMKSQSQVSILCDVFQQVYKLDLLDYLKRGYSQWNSASGLNENEINTVLQIVKQLPKYK
jgi:hypothetical protein